MVTEKKKKMKSTLQKNEEYMYFFMKKYTFCIFCFKIVVDILCQDYSVNHFFNIAFLFVFQNMLLWFEQLLEIQAMLH